MSIILIIILALAGVLVFGFIFAGIGILISNSLAQYKTKKQLKNRKGVIPIEEKVKNMDNFFE